MTSGRKTVLGIFESASQTDRAVDLLKERGFANRDVSVLMPDPARGADPGLPPATKAPEGIAAGLAGGAIVGGGLGWLVGIGSLAIPGLGPFLAAGPLVGALAGAGVGGAIGGVTGALIGLGIPEYEARRYEEILQDGGILLSVHVEDPEWAERAKAILAECGARDVHATGEIGVTNPGFRTARPADWRRPGADIR